jgi:hypothetical protein
MSAPDNSQALIVTEVQVRRHVSAAVVPTTLARCSDAAVRTAHDSTFTTIAM